VLPRAVRDHARVRKLTTVRLVARPPLPGDADALVAIYRHPGVARWFWPGRLPDDDDIATMLRRDREHWREHGFGRWYWAERGSGEVVAKCGPRFKVVEAAEEVSMHWAVRPDRHRRGIAAEAVEAAVTDAFRAVGCASLVAIAHVDNRASQALAERAGFRRERRVRDKGEPCALFRRYKAANAPLNASSSPSSIE
jgi:RimJ/RimL family protein N-acetyltransferase